MNAVRLSDEQIDRLVRQRKPLPGGWREDLLALKVVGAHARAKLRVLGDSGDVFELALRRSIFNHRDFSALLMYQMPETSKMFRLRRYNGLAHEHRNTLEGTPIFYEYHVHEATERYQREGFNEEHFAVPTNRYLDLAGALECLVTECGFYSRPEPQGSLFDMPTTE